MIDRLIYAAVPVALACMLLSRAPGPLAGMQTVTIWELGASSVFAIMVALALHKERRLALPMGSTQIVFCSVAAIVAAAGYVNTYQLKEPPAAAATTAPEAVVPVAAPAKPAALPEPLKSADSIPQNSASATPQSIASATSSPTSTTKSHASRSLSRHKSRSHRTRQRRQRRS